MPKALLFDVGDVLMEHNWRLLELLGALRDAPPSLADSTRGPFDPDKDPAYQRVLNHEITSDDYWDIVANAWGAQNRVELWRAMSLELGSQVFAKDSFELVEEARAARIPVGILSNDLIRSAGRAWVESQPQFSLFDVLVDCTEFGERKPKPAPYLKAASEFGLEPEQIVFLDDMQYCVDGARAVGMTAILVNPLHRSDAFDEARAIVGLPARQGGLAL